MIIPKEKDQEIDAAQKQITEVEKQYRKGVITAGERYNKIIDIWTHCTDQIANVMFRTLEHNQGKKEYNPVYLMVDSGARGNRQQVRQLAGMRGLMAKPSGDIIEKPILSNFREGLTVLEYFISTHGARKGLADTALKTADSGYMTRKLVDVAQDVIIREEDCGTTNGIWVQAIYEGEDEVVKLSERLIGRYLLRRHRRTRRTRRRCWSRPTRRSTRSRPRPIESVGRREGQDPLGADLRKQARRLHATATAATWPPARWSSWAKRSASSPPSPSASRARSSPCGRSTSAARRRQVFKQPQIKAKTTASSATTTCAWSKLEDGNNIVLNKNGSVSILGEDGRELEQHNVVIGAVISVDGRRQGQEGRDLRAVGSVQRADSLREGRAR